MFLYVSYLNPLIKKKERKVGGGWIRTREVTSMIQSDKRVMSEYDQNIIYMYENGVIKHIV